MKITKLEKKKRLYLLETDQGQSFYITEDTIVRYLLSQGKEVTEEELEEIQAFAQISYGKNLALYYISFQNRTKKEVHDYLVKYKIAPSQISSILQNLEADNWINDQRYCQNYLEGQLRTGNKGPYRLQEKLKQKGITPNLITQTLQEFDFSPLALKEAEKLQRKYSQRLSHRNLKTKITQALYQKGFTSDTIRFAMSQLNWEKDSETEEELLEKELDKALRRYQRRHEGFQLKQRLSQALLRKGFDYNLIKSKIDQALRDLD
ncbi:MULTISPECIES: recombination regulator RecX [unclassified Streptococcus]|uniref:recombination regulator RecX n=1 Tax=unclassified Streptococcus TaxID=2608887 RepID=UPI0010729004|nr:MULTISPECIES: recombination regulator RecX [unclassified Streptococcus]MBF0806116.1 recombination regulator RecX [Streptococcus sp. 19428wA2_WM07]TFU28318.1 recombination regulator RecX [Streptococcus sp. WM07]